jgi:hypothetical protein
MKKIAKLVLAASLIAGPSALMASQPASANSSGPWQCYSYPGYNGTFHVYFNPFSGVGTAPIPGPC